MNTLVIVLATIGGIFSLGVLGFFFSCLYSDWSQSRYRKAFEDGAKWQRNDFCRSAHWFGEHRPTADAMLALGHGRRPDDVRDEWRRHMKDYDPICNSYHPKDTPQPPATGASQ